MTIMRGDAYPVYIDLKQDGQVLMPDMISELEVCVGSSIRKVYSGGEVKFDEASSRWYFQLTQEETLSLPITSLSVIARVQYLEPKDDVIGIKLGSIDVTGTHSKVVL